MSVKIGSARIDENGKAKGAVDWDALVVIV